MITEKPYKLPKLVYFSKIPVLRHFLGFKEETKLLSIPKKKSFRPIRDLTSGTGIDKSVD